jgi:hypothetical protein
MQCGYLDIGHGIIGYKHGYGLLVIGICIRCQQSGFQVTGRNKVVYGSGLKDDGFEPHHKVISTPDQRQIYQAVIKGVDGEVTYILLRRAEYAK